MLRQQKGQVLIEVIVALSILLVGALPLINIMTGTARQLETTAQKLIAMELAQGKLEQIIGQSYADIHTLQDTCFPDPHTHYHFAVQVNESGSYGRKLKTICITVTYLDPTGQSQKIILKGFKADI